MSDYDVLYKIEKHFGVISVTPHGWSKELNFVSWNGAPAKFDIRDWDPAHERMSRGITLYENDAKKLYEILKSVFESNE